MARRPGPDRGRPGPPPANPGAAIQDWLNLVEPDGAFLTTTELLAAFPSGFDPMDAGLRTELRARVADLEADPSSRAELRRWLLATALDWDDLLAEDQRIPAVAAVRAPEHGVLLRPDAALVDVDDANRVRVGVFVWPLGTRLDRRTDLATAGDPWPASPVQRAETWCRESGTPLALVTDDDHWVVVWAPVKAPAASCRWRTADLADERILQSGLVSLLGAGRFFRVAADQTLEQLFERAADAEAEITKGLGLSVRRSVELLVAAISRDDVAEQGAVLDGVPATEVYEGAVSVLMRLVFLLFAEERRLLPAEDPLWGESYSVLTLRDDLRRAALRDGDDALERRSTAWHRLLATFRAVHGGANHDRLTLPAYGGSLFDPERFPFLEGRRATDHVVAGGVDLGPADDAAVGPGRPVAIDDRTVLAILDALLNVKVRAGRATVTQRVSYKALDVEQIGHCYEGLLDHGCAPVDALSLGLIGPPGDEPEIAVADLEAHLADGPDALCEWLADKTRCHRSASALRKELAREPEGIDLARLRVACGHDDATVERVLPFWGLIRPDLRGLPVVLLPGSQYVTQTSTRRNTGAQYTTKALAEEVAKYALEPLVYDPGPQNEADPERWRLRSPAAILDLRVCDPAVGSGAILTAAGRYLADRLVESVAEHGPGEGPFAPRLADLAAAPAEEQTVLARREVVDHCLYGVDKNPVAAEMAKLSLWLTTMARERPFTFLDHAIQVGDSLLGITDLEQLRWLHLDPAERKGQAGFATLALDLRLQEAGDLARRLQELSVVTVRDAIEKQRLHDELRATLADLSVVADAVVGAALSTAGKRAPSMETRLDGQLDRIRTALDPERPAVEREAALGVLRGVVNGWLRTDLPDDPPMPWDRQCLHWPLAFPEVFLDEGRAGFDAMVGNPPFLGGVRISEMYGDAVNDFLGHRFPPFSKRVDLCGFFFRRAATLLGEGMMGLYATNTISQGTTRKGSLEPLLDAGMLIYRANKDFLWPGDASVVASAIWLTHMEWTGTRHLQEAVVEAIDSYLIAMASSGRTTDPPVALVANTGLSFQGSGMWGDAFYLSDDEAAEMLAMAPRSADVIRRALGGKDLNASSDPAPRRWVIDMGERDLAEASSYEAPFRHLERGIKEWRTALDPKKYSRITTSWWKYFHARMELYEGIDRLGLTQVVARCRVSAMHMVNLVPARDVVFLDSLSLFLFEDYAAFGVLQSSLHESWAHTYGSTLKNDLRYGAANCFNPFPWPSRRELVEDPGVELHHTRRATMVRRGEGLTKTYNRVHDPDEHDPDVVRLRELHVELDHAVRDAYGWSDLPLDHHHWETPQGMRFTVSPEAKDELLDRLLELNHERYAAEVAAGLHDKKKGKAKPKRSGRKPDPGQEALL